MATKEKREEIFSSYPVPKAVVILAAPSVLANIVNVIYNMADTYFVSLMEDTNATAAVSLTMPVFLFFVAFGNIFGVGGSTYISRSLGEGKKDRVKNISAYSIYSSIISGFALLALILIFVNPIMTALGTTEATQDYAYGYLKYIAIGGPVIVTAITASNLVRGEGGAKESMIGMMLGTVTNIILDPIMILTLDMGVAGAAIATVIGNVASVVYYAIYLIRGNSILSCSPRRYTLKGSMAKNVVPVGVPAALNNILMSVSNILLNNCIKDYGEAAVAALGIAMKVNMLIVFVQMGVTIGTQPLIGYAYGAKDYKRLNKSINVTMLSTVIIGVVLTAIYLIFTEQIINVFNGENDPAVTEYGVSILRALLTTGPIIGIMFTCNFSFQAIGKPMPSLILSISRQGLVFLPLLIIMNNLIGFNGIIYAQPVADLVCIVAAVIMLVVIKHKMMKEDAKNNAIETADAVTES